MEYGNINVQIKEYISKGKNDKEFLNRIIIENENFFHFAVEKVRCFNTHLSREELLSEAYYTFLKCLRVYDPDRSVFTTYFIKAFKINVMDIGRKQSKKLSLMNSARVSSLEDITHEDAIRDITLGDTIKATDVSSNTELVFDLNIIEEFLNNKVGKTDRQTALVKRNCEMFRLYMAGYNQIELSEKYGITQSMISRIISKLQEEIKKTI